MSKMYLLVDAETCELCPAGRNLVSNKPDEVWACEIESFLHDEIKCVDEYVDSRPDWCPLRELPEKKAYDPAMPVTKQWGYEFTNGYNYCIDQILKEVFEHPIPYNGDNIGGRD